MLRLDHVSKRYGTVHALHPVTLELAAGRTSVLLGPSGCGKSTLLRLINGLISPTTGRISIDDTPLTPETARALRHRMGYVIQDGGLFPHLSARDNVTLLASHLGWPDERQRDRVDELRHMVQLPADALERYPAQLSGGQQQRISLMRALMLDPDVLLLDEPLGALDPMIRADLQQDLRRIFRSLNKTVVLVTHDLAEAGFLADEVLLMRAGTIEQHGPFRDLLDTPASPFVERFVQAQRSLHTLT
jgi:osmoprotectant transport system ATP-binding protein